MKVVGSIFLLSSLVFFSPAMAHAAPEVDGTLGVTPAVLEVTLEKNASEREVMLHYVNHSTKFVSVELFPIDFKEKDGTGALSFVGQEPGSYSYSLSSFLSFESRTLELAPSEGKDVTVRVLNREDLSPGGHYAAVVARVVGDKQDDSVPHVAPSLSSLILVRKVGGERFNMSLRDVSYPAGSVVWQEPDHIQLTFRNEGNIHLVPYGLVTINDLFGRMLYKGVINTGSLRVFPSAIRYIPVVMEQQGFVLPFSFNTLKVRGYDSLKKTSFSYEERYLYLNAWIGLGVMLLIFALILIKRRKR